jgi:hypothetical protein
MAEESAVMEKPNSYSTLQLRQLLLDIKEHAPHVCVIQIGG